MSCELTELRDQQQALSHEPLEFSFILTELDHPQDETEWVTVTYDEDQLLKECWEKLPIDLSYVDFRLHMQQAKDDKDYRHSWRRWSQNVIWFVHTLWLASGYASTLFTLAQYRAPILVLMRWFLH